MSLAALWCCLSKKRCADKDLGVSTRQPFYLALRGLLNWHSPPTTLNYDLVLGEIPSLKEFFIDFFKVNDLFNSAANIVTDHQFR